MIKTIDISKSVLIEGWMSEQELAWLSQKASEHTSILEIGCYQGRSTRALGDNTEGFVVTVDDFYGPRDLPQTEEGREKNYLNFVTNMKDLLISSKVRLAKISYDQIESDTFLCDFCPDMCFIDGDHSYESVKRDITYWKSKMMVGGLISGHDASYPPVAQAVGELLQNVEIATGTNIWFTYLW